MKVRFWGTRGSIPTPGPSTLKYGGNTSCVEVRTENGTLIILDCGSGIRELGRELLSAPQRDRDIRGHILLSHTHWDHIQGFPFFMPAFMPGHKFDIYAAADIDKKLADVLAGQMEYEYFPVTLDRMESRIQFNELREGTFEIDDVRVKVQYLNHTSLCLGYRLEADGKVLCYCTDIEPNSRLLLRSDFQRAPHEDFEAACAAIIHAEDRRYARFIHGADLLIHDAMYTEAEYRSKVGWGHSTDAFSTQIALLGAVKTLALYHHEPVHDDAKLDEMTASCNQMVRELGAGLRVLGASEGLSLTL
ncbi:MAG: MBL fold metallo-hydrolase [Armatimonadetes bacterium]|nr:MBL fold metallo-hydrolase [Armatimonadota bacterium]